MSGVWFRMYGRLYRLASYNRYGVTMHIRAVCTDGSIWDVLGYLQDVDERLPEDRWKQLDVENPGVVRHCLKLTGDAV
jgi:hypothetical protein